MAFDYLKLIDKYYPATTPLRDIYLSHCRAVANEALQIASRLELPLDKDMIEGAAMTHDIGIFATDAPSIECHGEQPYMCHGAIGGALLRENGAPEEWARVAERHTGSGLTDDDISRQHLPLPSGCYMPQSLLERLICYADKFYSKSGSRQRKTIEQVRRSMARFGSDSLARFEALHSEFNPEEPQPEH